jgi:hypothetical protein
MALPAQIIAIIRPLAANWEQQLHSAERFHSRQQRPPIVSQTAKQYRTSAWQRVAIGSFSPGHSLANLLAPMFTGHPLVVRQRHGRPVALRQTVYAEAGRVSVRLVQ